MFIIIYSLSFSIPSSDFNTLTTECLESFTSCWWLTILCILLCRLLWDIWIFRWLVLILLSVLLLLSRWLIRSAHWLALDNVVIICALIQRLLISRLLISLIIVSSGLLSTSSSTTTNSSTCTHLASIHSSSERLSSTTDANHIKLISFELSVGVETHYQSYYGKEEPYHVHGYWIPIACPVQSCEKAILYS